MIKVPASFNGRFITRHLFRHYFNNGNISEINRGRCYDWAYMAYRLFPNVSLWTTDYHAWVEAKDRHWDSETHKGVVNFMRLRCNERNTSPHCPPWDEQEPVIMNLYDFKNFWDRFGRGHRRHWGTLLESNLKDTLGKRYSEMTPIFEEAT